MMELFEVFKLVCNDVEVKPPIDPSNAVAKLTKNIDFAKKIKSGLDILYELAVKSEEDAVANDDNTAKSDNTAETDAKIREEDQVEFILATAEENRDFGEYYFEKRCGDSCMWERCKSLGKLPLILFNNNYQTLNTQVNVENVNVNPNP